MPIIIGDRPDCGRNMEMEGETKMKKWHIIIDFLIFIVLLAILILAVIGAGHLISQGGF